MGRRIIRPMRTARRRPWLIAATLAWGTAAAADPGPRVPVPPAADVAAAARAAADAQPEGLAVGTARERFAAAARLAAAAALEDRPARQFALLSLARDACVSAGDVAGACGAVDAIGARFDVDTVGLRCDAAAAAGRTAAGPAASDVDRQCAAPAVEAAADAAVTAGRFDLAAPLDALAGSLAAAGGDADLAAEVAAHVGQRAEERQGWAAAAGAAATLKANPTDPAALLAAGWFRCLVGGDWSAAGVKQLAGGSDPALAAAARADLPDDDTADARVAAADAWSDWAATPATGGHPVARRQALAHAAALYAAALPDLTGDARDGVARLLAGLTAEPAAGVVHRRVDLLRRVDLARDVGGGHWRETAGGGLACEAEYGARVAFPYAPPAAYDVRVTFARTGGNDDLNLVAVGNGHPFAYSYCGWGNALCGFDQVGGKPVDSNGTAVHVSLANGQPAVAEVRVRPGSVEAYLDGKRLGQRKTDFAEMGLAADHVLPRPDVVGLAAYQSAYRVTSAVLVERAGAGAEAPVHEVRVVSARFGGGNNWADVTRRVAQLLAAGTPVWVNPGTLGSDPSPGWRKHLELTYAVDGGQKTVSVDEDQPVPDLGT